MATSIGQYATVFLPGEPLSDRGAWQATVYRVAKSRTELKRPCKYKHKTFFFLPVAALSQWGLSMKVVQLPGLGGPWRRQVCRDTDCLRGRSYGLIRGFFPASCSWWSGGLFGQSFSVAPPIQVLRGIPCLGSISVFRLQAFRGPPWVGSCSVFRCISHWKEHKEWGPAL